MNARNAIVPFFLLIALTACAGAGVAMRDALVGRWHTESLEPEGEFAITETRNADGTFEGYGTQNGRRIWNYKGQWSLSGDRLHVQYTESDLPGIPAGTKSVDRVVDVSAQYVIFETEEGTQIRYVRQP